MNIKFRVFSLMFSIMMMTSGLVIAQIPVAAEGGAPAQEVAPAPAGAPADTVVEEGEEGAVPRKKIRDHRFQGVVNLTIGTGWYMVAPYDKDDPTKACGIDEDTGENLAVCTGRSSWHMDFLGGFGVKKGFEILMMYRQGLESAEMGKPQPRFIGAGFKVYNPADGLFKIGFGVFPLFDFSDRGPNDQGDFVIHIPIQAQFDFVRWFGAYAQVAPNLSFISEFRFDINFGLGIQARFP